MQMSEINHNGRDGMFTINSGKGFSITFENDVTVSVQFGPANYCQHYDRRIGQDDSQCGAEGSRNAECAVIKRDGEFVQHPSWDYDVEGYMTPAQVLAVMNWAASL